MIVERIWTGNAYRNFNYLIACPETGAALAIDPLDHAKCLARAKARGWTVTQILNTHEHGDHTGGNAAMIKATRAKLPDATLIYPGHDYIENNLRFTLNREPDNRRTAKLLEEVGGQDLDAPLVSTLALEKEINTFFRLHSPSVIAKLRAAFPDLPDDPDPRTVFLKLRELRNKW